MAYTTRQLVTEAYRVSGMKGTGETPDNSEANDALDILNGVLDVFSIQDDWKAGMITRDVLAKADKTIVIAKDTSRIFTSIVGDVGLSIITFTLANRHGLKLNDLIHIKAPAPFGEIDLTITNITSQYVLVTTNPTAVSGVVTTGTYKLQSEPDKYLIDLIMDPPNAIHSVISAGGTPLGKIMSDDFYQSTPKPYGWFYEKATDPYPILYVAESSLYTIAMEEPGWRELTLDTDLSKLPVGVKQALKWRLAGDLAQSNGYTDMAGTCLARYKEAFATYKRSRHQSGLAQGDLSAPGVGDTRYDITTDSYM